MRRMKKRLLRGLVPQEASACTEAPKGAVGRCSRVLQLRSKRETGYLVPRDSMSSCTDAATAAARGDVCWLGTSKAAVSDIELRLQGPSPPRLLQTQLAPPPVAERRPPQAHCFLACNAGGPSLEGSRMQDFTFYWGCTADLTAAQ